MRQVRVFKGHPEGVVTVKFKAEEAAQQCVQKMHGRFFAGRRLVAGMWDGRENFNVKVRVGRLPSIWAVRRCLLPATGLLAACAPACCRQHAATGVPALQELAVPLGARAFGMNRAWCACVHAWLPAQVKESAEEEEARLEAYARELEAKAAAAAATGAHQSGSAAPDQ